MKKAVYLNGATISRIRVQDNGDGTFAMFPYVGDGSVSEGVYIFKSEEDLTAVMTNLMKGTWARVE